MSQIAVQDPWSNKTAKAAAKKASEFLRDVAEDRITVESAFEYREDGGIRIALPQNPSKMSLKRAANMLLEQAAAEEAMYEYTKPFDCRPPDGALAFNKVLKDVYGMTAIGMEMRSFFGGQLPELLTVKTGKNEEVQVPWGLLSFPPLGAQFYLQERPDEDYGTAMQIYVHAKKKHEVEIRGLLILVEAYVRENSIYKGKALVGIGRTGLDGKYKDPEFLDPYTINRNKVIYSTEVQEAMEDEIWGIIQNSDLLREPYTYKVRYNSDDPEDVEYRQELIDSRVSETVDSYEILHDEDGAFYWVTIPGEEIGNKVLLHGQPGTGKTVGALVTAQWCLEEGWSFIQARFDEDLHHCMRFAELLCTPTVLVVEDVEKLIKDDPQKMDSLLELFDGMRTKGREVILLMTSNEAESLPQRLTRAGRINRMIYVSDLDTPGVEKLINALVPKHQREDLDYDALHVAYEGFAPSWIVQALKGVTRRSVIRTGKRGMPLATPDFVRCANALRPAWKLHMETEPKPSKPELVSALESVVAQQVRQELQQHFVDVSSSGDILVRD